MVHLRSLSCRGKAMRVAFDILCHRKFQTKGGPVAKLKSCKRFIVYIQSAICAPTSPNHPFQCSLSIKSMPKVVNIL